MTKTKAIISNDDMRVNFEYFLAACLLLPPAIVMFPNVLDRVFFNHVLVW